MSSFENPILFHFEPFLFSKWSKWVFIFVVSNVPFQIFFYSKMSFDYSKLSFQIFFISKTHYFISNLIIPNIYIKTHIFIPIIPNISLQISTFHSKLSKIEWNGVSKQTLCYHSRSCFILFKKRKLFSENK